MNKPPHIPSGEGATRLEAIATVLENETCRTKFVDTFNMGLVGANVSNPYSWFNLETMRLQEESACGTAGCILGHYYAMFKPEVWAKYVGNNYEMSDPDSNEYVTTPRDTETAVALDMTTSQAHELFFGDGVTIRADAAHAARAIRHLLATGEVDWIATATPEKRAELKRIGYID